MGPADAAAAETDQRVPLVEVPRPTVVDAARGVDALPARKARRHRTVVALFVLDVTALLAAAATATLVSQRLALRAFEFGSGASGPPYAIVSVSIAVMTVAIMRARRLYDPEKRGWGSAEFTRVGRSVVLGVIVTVVAIFLLGLSTPARQWTVLVALLGVAFVVTGRAVLRLVESRRLRREEWLRRPTLIVGSNVEAAEVVRLLKAHPDTGLMPVGCLRSSLKDKLSFDYCAPSVRTLGAAADLRDVVTEHGIDTVIIVASAFDYEIIKRMIKDLRGLTVSVHISSALSEVLSSRVLLHEVGGMPLISVKGVSLSPASLRTKRVFDCTIAGMVVLLGMPLWLLLSGVIKATSEGTVFYKQERIGRDGTPFWMYKFRSMVADADRRLEELEDANEADGPIFKIHDDPRVTAVGCWMRKFSLDEFPQLINVLKGEMSLVGPRPPLPRETVQYSEADWRRLDVPPGMTGLWQVSGRSDLSFRDMVRLDCFYIDNWSVGLDASLLVRTVPAVVLARGAC